MHKLMSQSKKHSGFSTQDSALSLCLKGTSFSFTLLELIIVVVILGILAAVAIPTYQRTVEKSRAGEAIMILGHIREAEMEYHQRWGTFYVENDIVNNYTNTSSGTSWENKLAVRFNSNLWEFTIPVPGAGSGGGFAVTNATEDWILVSARRIGKDSYINLNIANSGNYSWSGNHPGTPSE